MVYSLYSVSSVNHFSSVFALSTVDWVVDTGAIDHVSYSMQNFKNSHPVFNMYVQLHTSVKLQVSHVGEVQLYPNLTITNVLYVPEFHFNLLSVSRLTLTTSYCLMYSGDNCLIEDQFSMILIGYAKLKAGLFILQPTNYFPALPSLVNTYAVSTVKGFDLWHFCLGHASVERIQKIHQLDSNVSSSSFAYDLCPMAKQKRLPFSEHVKNSISAFDLIHVDL